MMQHEEVHLARRDGSSHIMVTEEAGTSTEPMLLKRRPMPETCANGPHGATNAPISASQCSDRHEVKLWLSSAPPGGNVETLTEKVGSYGWPTVKGLYGKVPAIKFANAPPQWSGRARLVYILTAV